VKAFAAVVADRAGTGATAAAQVSPSAAR
jgi:hypothetical protein